MSFVKRLWKDRVSQYPNRRAIYDGSFSKSVTVSRDEGTITEAGDPFNAENMNDLEDRIEAGLAEKPDREEVEDMVTDFFPLGEASGAIASFNPGVILPLRSCECQINATQAGTGDPSPSNPRAISGFSQADISVCGKNFLNAIERDTTKGFIDGQFITYAGSLSGANTFNGFVTVYFPLKANTQYVISGISGGSPSICFYDKEKNFISGEKYNSRSSFTFTTDETVAYARASVAYTQVSTAQIEKGSSPSSYSSYKGNLYTVSFGQTIYGGRLNVGSGVLTVTHGYVDNLSTSLIGTTSLGVKYADVPISGLTRNANAKSNMYQWIDADTSGVNYSFKTYGNALTIYDNNFTDITTANLILSNLQVVYELATPVIIPITSATRVKTIIGENNIYHDCNGNIDVIFHKALAAKNISFDNSGTTLTATNVEDAIKEVLGRI